MTRVLFPAWNMDSINWARLQNTLKPIAERNELLVIYPDHIPEVSETWATFIRIPSYRQFRMVDMQSLTDYVVKILMKAPDFDVIYSFSSGPFFQMISTVIARMSGRPCIMHINGHGALARSFYMKAVEKLKEDVVDTITLNNVDRLVPISSHLRDVIRERVLDPSRVIDPVPFSVDLEAFQLGPMPSKFCIGYAGRISPEKGTEFLLQVMAETPEIKYRVAGPIEKLDGKFPDNCNYTGVFEHFEMFHFYHLCSILTLPSYGEGISAQILEAYACGRGIICTPEAHPDELPVFGYEVPLDLEAWKKTVRNISNMEALKKGRQARQWLEENWPSWDDFGDRMTKIFLDAVSNK